eukprot:CAMPEP_0175968676 /NCGR_PEP_ID=MMETSP0108-20121206/40023_1 /TAXON_ID=195067 ORGANISM="Goniomonas pacifica, Strain CCMP1869" /NCGR_SAMPLE_ID=MMETSP0108 /ASSEMBLY_ACC=CAM_ASM_000204 /LENGTH=140 /DNA_ID=CAMNT_0017297343 /DNA_START=233 /DNA_END=651 /DNA_ORIENTATION=-
MTIRWCVTLLADFADHIWMFSDCTWQRFVLAAALAWHAACLRCESRAGRVVSTLEGGPNPSTLRVDLVLVLLVVLALLALPGVAKQSLSAQEQLFGDNYPNTTQIPLQVATGTLSQINAAAPPADATSPCTSPTQAGGGG